jgi:tRNA U34 5-methylaminomethyl-2-thiouridine-forming methyltransferase MnmC
MKKELIITEDGSHTIFIPSLNEHYHSIHGAVQESMHVFIRAGLNFLKTGDDTLNILEVGLGTGLNVLLTCIETSNTHKHVIYTAIESHPLDRSVWGNLNYSQFVNHPAARLYFTNIHEASWNSQELIRPGFELEKRHEKLENSLLPDHHFQLVYFDAFAPGVQPELWTESIFLKIFTSMTTGGILVTYSSKGEVKRALIKVGFITEKLPGPPGKREMLRAVKS